MIRFISDLHLDPKRPDTIRAFFTFLETCKSNDTTALYILGDFFEYWIGDDLEEPWIEDIKIKLFNCHTHFPIYIMHGNRDFTLSKKFTKSTNTQLIKEPYNLHINNKTITLMHGDLLCTDDISYLKFRKIIRNPIILFILKKLPLTTRLKLASKLRSKSNDSMQNKNELIMDATHKGVIEHSKRNNCDILIHGHTHRANIHQPIKNITKTVTRITLGDWHTKAFGLNLNEKNAEYELIDYLAEE